MYLSITPALMLRESMLINGTLYNAEAWYNMSRNEVKELETSVKHKV